MNHLCCKDCYLWDVSSDALPLDKGYCRREPPEAGVGWPVTNYDDWCWTGHIPREDPTLVTPPETR